MMKNGSLREADERKYGLYGKVGYINKMITACAKKQLPTVSLLQVYAKISKNIIRLQYKTILYFYFHE